MKFIPTIFVLRAGSILRLFRPLLRPALNLACGTTLVVVLDGYHRLDAALTCTGSLPMLLITCPRTGRPSAAQRQRAHGRPFWVVRQGWDSAHQLTVLARWLQQPSTSKYPALPSIGTVLLVSDSHHLPRLPPGSPSAARPFPWLASPPVPPCRPQSLLAHQA